jgi:hypothetical protein
MDDQFNKWVDLWDKAQGDMPKIPPVRQADTSFFGMKSVDDENLDAMRARDLDAWKDVDARTDQLYAKVDSHQLFIEAKKEEAKAKSKKKSGGSKKKTKSAAESTHEEADPDDTDGLGAILSKALGDKDQVVAQNPITFYSVGMDQKLRVTPNWTSGGVLQALSDIKKAMYDLECEMLSAEAYGCQGRVQVGKPPDGSTEAVQRVEPEGPAKS